MEEHVAGENTDWSSAMQRAVARGDIALPGLPEMALRIRQTVVSESATAGSLAQLIAEDAALTTRIMKVANAAAMRRASPVSRLDRAIGVLGFSLVHSLVTGLCLLRQLERHTGPVGERLRAHHEHAVKVAAVAHYLAGSTPGVDEHEALLAGLVHDIGALPVLDFAARQPALANDPVALDALLARHHTPFGARILVEWHFPEQLVAVAARHEDVDRRHDGPTDLLDVAIAANLQCHWGTRRAGARAPALERFNLIAEPLARRDGAQESIDELHRDLLA